MLPEYELAVHTYREIAGSDLLPLYKQFIRNATGGPHPVSATVLTLALYVDHHPSDVWNRLAEQLAESHPSRVLVIRPSASAEGAPRLDVKIGAAIAPRSHQWARVYSEFLELTIKGALRTHWIDFVQPLILSDLPAYLWWLAKPPDKSFRWDLLAGAFSHFILDSGQSPLREWSQSLWRAMDGGLAVDDLEWFRLSGWRVALADLGDHPQWQETLFNPTSLHLHWPRAQLGNAFLLLGWLAERLQWISLPHRKQFQKPDGGQLSYVWSDAERPSLEIEQGETRLRVARVQPGIAVSVEHQSDTLMKRIQPEQPVDPAAALLHLLSRGHDPLYEDAVTWALTALNDWEH